MQSKVLDFHQSVIRKLSNKQFGSGTNRNLISSRHHVTYQSVRGGRLIVPKALASENSDPLYLQNGKPHISTSLFRPFEKLPYDGQTLSPEEEGCDPETSRCKTKIHVWEVRCEACHGTGTIVSSSRHRRRMVYTCLQCTGLGYVRHTSSQVEPVKQSAGSEEYYTLGRPQPPPAPEAKQQAAFKPRTPPAGQPARGRRRESHK